MDNAFDFLLKTKSFPFPEDFIIFFTLLKPSSFWLRIHLELSVCMVAGRSKISFSSHMDIQLSLAPFIKRNHYFTVAPSCHLFIYQRRVHLPVCLPLGSLFCLISIFPLFLPIPYCFHNHHFITNRPGHHSVVILFKNFLGFCFPKCVYGPRAPQDPFWGTLSHLFQLHVCVRLDFMYFNQIDLILKEK